ncbi:MAG: DUF4238 domain-containing protein [Proteobacteria bacterium]|nr:DUF4238 domain-containing protein [Pseudomonadota bacterium]
MAIRQHILPRFLLKGFASRTNKNKVYAWVYQKDGRCYEPNIINIAVGRKFYGEDGEGTADGKITDFEGQFAPLLDQMRYLKHGEEVDRSEAAEFVSHMEIRTKHIRDSFLKPVKIMANEFGQIISNLEDVNLALSDDPHLKNKFQKLPAYQKKAILAASKKFFATVEAATPQMVKQGHVQSLSKTVAPEWRVQRYCKFFWYVCHTEQNLILGDVGIIWEVSDNRKFVSITFKADTINNIFLPISSNKMLVGTTLPQAPGVNVTAINLQVARMSREYFVASAKSQNMAELVRQIGQKSELLSEKEARELVRNKLKR